MTETMSRATIAEVSAALSNAESAWTGMVLLGQDRTDSTAVKRLIASQPDTALGKAGRQLVDARKAFQQELEAQCRAAQARATQLGTQTLQALFGQAIPGAVTLPLEDCGRCETHLVTGLSSIHEQGGVIGGFVNTEDHRCRSTERFYVKNGQAYFARPDIY